MHACTRAHTHNTHLRTINFVNEFGCVLKELDESTKELEECEKRLKSMDESLVTAQKGSEGLVKRLMMLEKAMKEQNYGSNSELSSIQR